MVDIAASGYAAFSCFYFLLVDADLADFDPRPAMFRAVESGRLDPVLVMVANVKYGARCVAVGVRLVQRDLSAPATAPKGATHV